MIGERGMRYIGPIEHLRGKLATVKMDVGEVTFTVYAQFDEIGLTRSGDPADFNYLGFGWHAFERKDFEDEE